MLISAAVGVPIGGTLANSLSLGGNPSGGGTLPNIIYESFPYWSRALQINEVRTLVTNPAAINWQPSNRAYSFMSSAAAAAGYLLVKN